MSISAQDDETDSNRTSNDYCETGKASISFHEGVEYDTGPSADGHGQEERRPTLGKEMSYMLVSVCDDRPTNRRNSKGNHKDERNGCLKDAKMSLGNKAQQ